MISLEMCGLEEETWAMQESLKNRTHEGPKVLKK
jgi:hypothetical protein